MREGLDRISAAPDANQMVEADIRRLLRRFPYALFYVSTPDAAIVLACFHVRRDPISWRGRE
ncbi:MAG: hypothetical protein IT381_01830 [Deltaproteobacteria bacterium]|nr:hypothetical protein [Deltaproteobacteria bacterium]